MVLGDAGWERKESPESNLHVCGKDSIKIVVYNMERYTEKRGEKIKEKDRNSCAILLFNKTL